MILEIAILNVRAGMAHEFEAAFTRAASITPTIEHYTLLASNSA